MFKRETSNLDGCMRLSLSEASRPPLITGSHRHITSRSYDRYSAGLCFFCSVWIGGGAEGLTVVGVAAEGNTVGCAGVEGVTGMRSMLLCFLVTIGAAFLSNDTPPNKANNTEVASKATIIDL